MDSQPGNPKVQQLYSLYVCMYVCMCVCIISPLGVLQRLRRLSRGVRPEFLGLAAIYYIQEIAIQWHNIQ